MIKSTVKEIIQLPTDVPDSMLYTQTSFKGLGIFKTKWEVYLQFLNACQKLKLLNNPYIIKTRKLQEEIEYCLSKLEINLNYLHKNQNEIIDIKCIRNNLRLMEFKSWCLFSTS